MKMRVLFLSLCLASLSAFGADLSITLTPPTLNGTPGQQHLVFSGVLQDLDPPTTDPNDPLYAMYLNDINVTFDSPGDLYLSAVDPTAPPGPNPFFTNNVNGTLLADSNNPDWATYSGPIFEIFIASNTALGTYTGTISVLGGHTGPGDTEVLGTQTFQVVVTPEPATLGFMAAGLAGVLLASRRRRLQ